MPQRLRLVMGSWFASHQMSEIQWAGLHRCTDWLLIGELEWILSILESRGFFPQGTGHGARGAGRTAPSAQLGAWQLRNY